MSQLFSLTTTDSERTLEFEFVRATENAALNVMQWLGRGEKELAYDAACDAIHGVFDLVDMRGEVVIGEGIKDNAPGIFLGDKLGNWKPDAPEFDIALDPVDGTSNLAQWPAAFHFRDGRERTAQRPDPFDEKPVGLLFEQAGLRSGSGEGPSERHGTDPP